MPASTVNICRYIVYLARTKRFSSINQYLNIIRLLHLENNLPHPYENNYHITSLLKGVKRVKGDIPNAKSVLHITEIHAMKASLDLSCLKDLQVWCAILLCFYGLLRISSVTVPSKSSWDATKILTRKDITVSPTGCILHFKHSKTLQFGERIFQAVIPLLPHSPTCPTRTLVSFLQQAGEIPPDAPALSFRSEGGTVETLTAQSVRRHLHQLVRAIGLHPSSYNTHSLRRSGATYLLSLGVTVDIIKILGDWKSDCVFKYLKPSPIDQLRLLNDVTH